MHSRKCPSRHVGFTLLRLKYLRGQIPHEQGSRLPANPLPCLFREDSCSCASCHPFTSWRPWFAFASRQPVSAIVTCTGIFRAGYLILFIFPHVLTPDVTFREFRFCPFLIPSFDFSSSFIFAHPFPQTAQLFTQIVVRHLFLTRASFFAIQQTTIDRRSQGRHLLTLCPA